MNWILTRILKLMGGKLEGKNTIIGGLGKILLGIGTCFTAITMGIRIMFPDHTQFPDADTNTMLATFGIGVGFITAGYTNIGMARKMDKQTDAINTQTQAIVSSVHANTAEVSMQGAKTVESVQANTDAVSKGPVCSPEKIPD